MKKNTVSVFILSIVAVIGGMVLNFQEFLMGSTANVKNLLVTFIYIAIWILVVFLGYKIKSRTVMKYCCAFWIATFLVSLLILYVNATGATVTWAIPFVIVLLGQWYGVIYFVDDFLTASIIIALISFGMSAAAALLLRRIK